MNNKGFTLIELIGIIVILSAIFLISFPSLLNTSKIDEEKKYEDMVENLCLAGKTYIYSNQEEYQYEFILDNKIEISINTLIEFEYVDSKTKNPKTDESINSDKLVYKVLEDNLLECEYVSE